MHLCCWGGTGKDNWIVDNQKQILLYPSIVYLKVSLTLCLFGLSKVWHIIYTVFVRIECAQSTNLRLTCDIRLLWISVPTPPTAYQQFSFMFVAFTEKQPCLVSRIATTYC